MNRCQAPVAHASRFRTPTRRHLLQLARLALAAPLLAWVTTAHAQIGPRPFPANAERGTLVVIAPPVIQLNGKRDSLSPGARIRGMNNLLLLSGSIIGQSLVVNYVRNPTGEVHEVWVLTPDEVAQPLPAKP